MAINTALALGSPGPMVAHNSTSDTDNAVAIASPSVRAPDQVVRERLIDPIQPSRETYLAVGTDSMQQGNPGQDSVASELERIYREHCPGRYFLLSGRSDAVFLFKS
jgi:hypothetical protein